MKNYSGRVISLVSAFGGFWVLYKQVLPSFYTYMSGFNGERFALVVIAFVIGYPFLKQILS